MTMVQKRHTKTEDKIRLALAKLMREKGFDAFTVSDVAREAGINRGTFYAHYVDKFDLVEKQINSLVDDLTAIIMEEGDVSVGDREIIPHANVLSALEYVRENYEIIGALTAGGTDTRLQGRVKDVFGQLIERQATRFPELTMSYQGIPRDYGREMLLSSLTSVIWLWLRKGCEESPEKICEIVLASKDLAPVELLD